LYQKGGYVMYKEVEKYFSLKRKRIVL